MPYVLRIDRVADGSSSGVDGEYLVKHDPGANAGRGLVIATPQADDAQAFDTVDAALAEYRRIAPPPHELRADGKPNRPLTAYDVTVVEIPGRRAR